MEKIIGAYMSYAKTLGKVDLLKNLTETLKAAQSANVEIRKKFAEIAPEIIKAAKLKDLEAQSADYQAYVQALYGQQTEREKLRLTQVHEGMAGLTSGLRLKGLIGSILMLIPGLEETGKKWVDEVKAESLALGEALPKTSLDIKRNAGAANIQTGVGNIGALVENATSMLSSAAVAREAGAAIGQMDPTSSDVTFNGGQVRGSAAPQGARGTGARQQTPPNPASQRAADFSREFEDPAPRLR
jgi:hypothetical protein